MRTLDTSTDRLEIFSDGVIAIAITLLILDVKVPDSKSGQLLHDLGSQWPAYVAYVLSFSVIGIMWVSHHSMFERIRAVDRGLLFTNLALLLGIAFLPFPTALLARYVQRGGSDAHVAAAIYSATMAAIGVAFLGIWLVLRRHPDLLSEHAQVANLNRSIRLSLVGPIVYSATIGLAFLSATACFFVYALMAIYFAFGVSSRELTRALPARRRRSAARTARKPPGTTKRAARSSPSGEQ